MNSQKTASVYPLQWPASFPRTEKAKRQKSRFNASLPAALRNVRDSLRLFSADSAKAITGLVLSSNVSLGDETPDDPGVAVWFTWDGLQICIPVDRYTKPQENLQAIHHIIEARRTELRHGTLQLVRASFAGFKALPAAEPAKGWWETLRLFPEATLEEAEEAYRRLAKIHHPDAGGNADKMAALNKAIETARRELR